MPKLKQEHMNLSTDELSIVMLGATGAVGTEVLKTLLGYNNIKQLTLLGRRPIPEVSAGFVQQYKMSIHDTSTYKNFLQNHSIAICTLGVGQPSKMSKEDFVKIDKTAVLEFAKECKKVGVKHFQLLSSVGISPHSRSFFLRTKGELVEGLKALNFERLSIFQPSMILTPTNRYGFSQAITLKVWPLLKPLLIGGLMKYRGVPVEILGQAMAMNIFIAGEEYEVLQWEEFYSVVN